MLVVSAVASGPLLSQHANASPPALQACTANNVRVSATQLGEVRGRALEAIQLKNVGSTTCGMDGYPNLTFFTSSRLDSRVKVLHDATGYASVAPKLIAIGPDVVVSFGLSYRDDSTTTVPPTKGCLVESILIQIPLAPTSSGDFAYHENLNACQAGNVVSVTPMEARALPKRVGK